MGSLFFYIFFSSVVKDWKYCSDNEEKLAHSNDFYISLQTCIKASAMIHQVAVIRSEVNWQQVQNEKQTTLSSNTFVYYTCIHYFRIYYII